QLIDDRSVRRRQIVEPFQIFGGTPHVVELLLTDASAASEQLAHQRPVEHLFQRSIQDRGGARVVPYFFGQTLELIQPRVVHVGHQRVAEPSERLVGVAQIGVGDLGCPSKQRAARAAAITRALTAGRERLRQSLREQFALALFVRLARNVFQDAERLFLNAARQRNIEELASAIESILLGGNLSGARQPAQAVGW